MTPEEESILIESMTDICDKIRRVIGVIDYMNSRIIKLENELEALKNVNN